MSELRVREEARKYKSNVGDEVPCLSSNTFSKCTILTSKTSCGGSIRMKRMKKAMQRRYSNRFHMIKGSSRMKEFQEIKETQATEILETSCHVKSGGHEMDEP